MSTPDDVNKVVHDAGDTIEALQRTMENVEALMDQARVTLLCRAIAEVATRHSFALSANDSLKHDFWTRAEAVTGLGAKQILESGAT